MDEQSGAFSEVLSIGIDTSGFAADLSKLESMWGESLDRMADKAQDAALDPNQLIPVAAIQALQDTLTELSARVGETTGTIADDFSTMATSVTAELEQMNSAAAKTRENLQAVANSGSGGGSVTKRGAKRSSIFGVDPEKGIVGNFFQGMTMGGQGANGIAALAGYMVTMETIGAGLFAVIQGITSIITAIPRSLMEGVNYLEKFQQDASDLQGVMASNLKFSGDFAENFKMAGQAAEYAVSHLKDAAVKDNLDPKQLQNSFKALVDSGGGAMTKDVSELVDLTTQFALAMKAAGKSSEGTRSLVSEIPKLMEGTEGPSSKLLQTLHLTKAEWEGIRQHALEHKDLLAELAPILAPYIAQVQSAQANHEELTKQLDRQKEVIESAFAVPVVKEFDSIIRGTLDYISNSKNSIELLANMAGQLIAEVLKLGPALADVGGEGHPVLAYLAEGFRDVILIVETFKGTLLTTGHAAGQLFQVLKTPLGGNVKGALENASKDIQAFQDKQSEALAAERQRLDLMVESVDASKFSTKATDAESGGKNYSFSGRAPLPKDDSKAELAKMRQEFTEGFEGIKEKYNSLLDAEKQAEAEQTESVHAGTLHRMALRRGEVEAAQALYDQMVAKFGNVPGAAKTLAPLKEYVDKLKAETTKQDTADATEDFKTTRSIDESNYKTKEQLAETHFRTMSELFKRSAQEGLMSYADAAKAEIEQQKKLYAEKRDLAVKNFNDAHKNGVDPNSEDAGKFQHSLDVASAQEQAQRSQDSHTLGRASLQDSSEQHSRETAAINAQMSYTQAVSDGADKQDQLNALLAKRLKADNDYLLAVERNPTHTTAEVRSAMSNVNADKLAQNNQYNATHLFQRDVTTDDAGNVTGSKGAGLFSDIAESSKAVSQAFAILEQTTKELMSAQGNLYQKISAGAGGASSMLEGLGDSSSGLGKLGSALGMSSDVASALPGIGAAVGAVGSVIGMIGQMFAQQAKNIANDVQKKFDLILHNYQNNTASFTQTMQALQQEQQTAIQQLSGVKGGQGYLSQILLQIQQTEAALKAQAAQAQNNFEIQTAAAIQSTQVGQQWMQTWASIEQQVHDYLYKDGGNTQMAAEYQNAELAQQSLQIQQQYNQGLQTAIQDNYTLNGLMLSRQQIQLSILQLEDSMSDSIERRQAPAMGLAAQQTKLQLQQLQQQLSDTNNSISIEQQKVTAENAVFGLTTDINALHAADAASQMVALNEQLANYQEMLKIIQQISGLQASSSTGYFGGHSPFAGLPGGVPGFGATNAPTPPAQAPIVINGPITVSLPGVSGTSDVARGIAAELQNWARFGVSS